MAPRQREPACADSCQAYRIRLSPPTTHSTGGMNTFPRSRDAFTPECCKTLALEDRRGRRECRVMTSPMARLQIKKQAAVHHRFSRINRHSLRDGLRLISRSPRGPGFLAPVIPEKLASQELDLSVGRPGPRDFTVRESHVRLTCHPRPPHPRLTCRDERAYVPLHRGRMREKIVPICPTPQAPTPAADWHDGQFSHGVYTGIARRAI
jgi:hypothetical protein